MPRIQTFHQKDLLLSKCIKSNDEKLLLKYQYQHDQYRDICVCALRKHNQEAGEFLT